MSGPLSKKPCPDSNNIEASIKVNANEMQNLDAGICLEKASNASSQTVSLSDSHNSNMAFNVDETKKLEQASTRSSSSIG